MDTELDRAAARRQRRFGGPLAGPARLVAALLRRALVRYARARPRQADEGKPPKVFILTVSGWGKGGTTRTMLNVAEYLAREHEVEIISLWRLRDEPVFEHPPGVTVTALDDLRPQAKPRGLRGLPRRLLKAVPSALVEPGDRWSASFSLLSDIRLVRMLRRQTGILITTRPALNLIAALLDPPGLILIGSEHMHLASHKKSLRQAMRRRYPRLDAFVVLTEGGLRDYEQHLDGNVRLLRIPNSARDLGDPADLSAKTVLAAGRLTRQKGFDLLIPAWAQVAAKHPDWRLRICGEGQLRGKLEAQAERLGLADTIAMPGACDMVEAMGRASIFVMSSRFEGFPLILIEAMGKGMAPVSFDCPTGPADVIDSGRNGILVPLGDVDGLARAILELIEDDELRRRCGPAAAETARAFRIENVGPMWDALFRELGESRPAAS